MDGDSSQRIRNGVHHRSMTTYTEQFAGMTTGIDPTNFTSRYATTTGYSVENPADSEAEDDRVHNQDGTVDTGGMWTFDDIDGDANRDNCEIVARFRVGGDADSQFALWARAFGSDGNKSAYVAYITTGVLRVGRYDADTFLNQANSVDLDFSLLSPWFVWGSDRGDWAFASFPVGNWLWMRYRVNGTGATVTHSAKVWADGQDEPADWMVEDADSDAARHTAAGWCGWNKNDFTASEDTEVDYFSVGTNGDSPVIATSADLAAIRLTGHQMAAAVSDGDPIVRITAHQMSAAIQSANPEMRLTGSYLQVLYTGSPPPQPQMTEVMVIK